jgi:hypothetical protein
MRKTLLLTTLCAPVAMMLTPLALPSGLSAQWEIVARDLYIKGANGDGTFTCAQWCGLLESCC